MKYIMFMGELARFPVMFPDNLVHDEMARLVSRQIFQTTKQIMMPISAGFVDFVPTLTTHGKSETLGIESQPYDAHYIALGSSCWMMPPEFVSNLYHKMTAETTLRASPTRDTM